MQNFLGVPSGCVNPSFANPYPVYVHFSNPGSAGAILVRNSTSSVVEGVEEPMGCADPDRSALA